MMRHVALLLGLVLGGCIPFVPFAMGQAPQPEEACVRAGCSGQLCVDARQGDMASTCEWREAYGCYQNVGVCERQADGACGWTQTDALQACLAGVE